MSKSTITSKFHNRKTKMQLSVHRTRALKHDHPYCDFKDSNVKLCKEKVPSVCFALIDHTYTRPDTPQFKRIKRTFNIPKKIQFNVAPLLRNHIKNASSRMYSCMRQLRRYLCKVCKHRTHFLRSLVHHKDLNSKRKLDQQYLFRMFACSTCTFQSYSVLFWMKHSRTCSGELIGWICCSICSFRCKEMAVLDEHQSFAHWKSGKEGMSHLSHILLRNRIRTDNKVQCEELKTKSYIVVKKNLHPKVNVRWFKCAHCSYKALRSYSLENHICANKVT